MIHRVFGLLKPVNFIYLISIQAFKMISTFNEFGLKQTLFKALDLVGYETPTPIQAQTIPLLLQKKMCWDRHKQELEKRQPGKKEKIQIMGLSAPK